MAVYYPAFLDLKGRHCVVVGGGAVSERKVHALLKAGAKVTVISEALTVRLKRQSERGLITHLQRNYSEGDLKGAFLTIAATSDRMVNQRVARDAPFLVNVVDDPKLSNFIVPATVSKGPLTIAVSTQGTSPAMAALIRKDLETLYGSRMPRYLTFLKAFRQRVLREIKDSSLRREVLKGAVSREALQRLRTNGYKEAIRQLNEQYKRIKGNKA
jgi:precorrin-2 dehydrogenase/sirohydrochlorin ferrochelatase